MRNEMDPARKITQRKKEQKTNGTRTSRRHTINRQQLQQQQIYSLVQGKIEEFKLILKKKVGWHVLVAVAVPKLRYCTEIKLVDENNRKKKGDKTNKNGKKSQTKRAITTKKQQIYSHYTTTLKGTIYTLGCEWMRKVAESLPYK